MREHDLDRDPPSADLLAGEYVLGVLDARTRREARLRAAHDTAFARLIDDWARRLDPLHDELPAASVPAHVWPRLRTRLGWSPVERASAPGVGFWKAATAAGFAIAAALAVVAVKVPRTAAPTAPVASTQKPAMPTVMPEMPVTRLVTDRGQIAYLATVDAHGGGMWLVPVPGTVPEGQQAPVLWLIAPGHKPKSLGYVGASKSHWVDVPKDELHAGMQSGWTVAITMEPVQPVAPQVPSSKPMAAGTLSL
ncbi:anti-sigma factor [Cognatilysobacter terrigena]|uniref:anti-sigma factor n=1 Tax=Cognatilysobacter terrigena TaxID=2488749 RepID=UPI001414D309|nr:anti-sigma factor [Lysobacter terrigena]